ncbi:MAG TPA: hypothetical protein VFA03_00740 [Acetobacteraceae bacterium]|nr:hypothetical protein [Acetobacteraceae bacterium]
MLSASLALVAAAGLLGLVLILLHGLRKWTTAARLGLFHAVLGAGGTALLIAALAASPARGAAAGAGGFGRAASWFLLFAFLAGLSIWRARRRGRAETLLLIGIHATLAVFGIVFLATYVAAP